MIVAIDGPAGAGKSSVARGVADALGYTYLNSGSMYRAVGLLTLREGGAASDHAEALQIQLGDRVLVGGEDVTDELRTPDVSEAASKVATNEKVRAALVRKQRELLAQGDWVAEGRDIGSVVARDAELKVFLTASAQERARRRAAQLGADEGAVAAELGVRDVRDSTRAHSPLAPAPGAVTLDTSPLTLEQVVERVLELAQAGRAQ
jgi:cytidylate kinase